MLRQLHKWISKLKFDAKQTTWGDYAEQNTYLSDERQKKLEFVADFVNRHQPKLVWDLGCNAGDYSEVALQGGTQYVVGWDIDQGALDAGFGQV